MQNVLVLVLAPRPRLINIFVTSVRSFKISREPEFVQQKSIMTFPLYFQRGQNYANNYLLILINLVF